MPGIFRLGYKGHSELASPIGGFFRPIVIPYTPRLPSLHFFHKILLQNQLTKTINNLFYYYNKNINLKNTHLRKIFEIRQVSRGLTTDCCSHSTSR